MKKQVPIDTEFIKMGALLKYAGVVDIGSQAKELIESGKVRFNGEIETRRGKKVRPGDKVEANGVTIEVTEA